MCLRAPCVFVETRPDPPNPFFLSRVQTMSHSIVLPAFYLWHRRYTVLLLTYALTGAHDQHAFHQAPTHDLHKMSKQKWHHQQHHWVIFPSSIEDIDEGKLPECVTCAL